MPEVVVAIQGGRTLLQVVPGACYAQPWMDPAESPGPGVVTGLLAQMDEGDPRAAVDRLLPILYGELYRIARQKMRYEHRLQALDATGLVHEAFIRLADQRRVRWKNRAHFLGVAAMAMRRILINAANALNTEKRGGGAALITFDDQVASSKLDPEQVLALDELLDKLAQHDPRQARIAELRIFAGMTFAEIAEVLGVSTPTVRRHWRFARAWMASRLDIP